MGVIDQAAARDFQRSLAKLQASVETCSNMYRQPHMEEKKETKTMPLFEVAVLSKPNEEAKKNGAVQELILPPTFVIAEDSMGAIIQATQGTTIDATKVEVLVRPFA